MIKMLKNTTPEEMKNALNEIKTENDMIYVNHYGEQTKIKKITVDEKFAMIELIGGTRLQIIFENHFYLKYINKKLEIQ